MSEDLPRDTTDTAARLQSMYDLSEGITRDIMGAAPYAEFSCILIDLHFARVVEISSMRSSLTSLAVEVLGDLVTSLLDKAQQAPEVIPYLHAGFRALGHGNPDFPEGLDYQRAVPAMRLLLPRLVEIRLESLTQPRAE